MVLRHGYLAIALKLQEAAESDREKFDASLNAALAAATEPGPWKSFLEAGARHSASDMGHLQSIHDAAAVLGATCGGMSEAAKPAVTGSTIQLVESFDFAEAEVLQLREAGTVRREIKIIAPGKGCSAIYPEEVLKRDAAKTFIDKTQIYINHATRAEESERPEGDWHKLVGALDGPAYWKDDGKYGKGVYGMAEFAAEAAPAILTKAPWSGMSIRANGNAVTEGGRTKLQDGLPVLKEFTGCESIDVVTRAGAGGMILTEAAKAANPTEGGAVQMDQAEVTKLIESAVKAAQAPLLERALRGDAREEATRAMRGVSLPEQSKQRVIESVMAREIPTKDGALDSAKLIESITAAAKAEGEYVASLTGGGAVRGMGLSAAPVKQTADQLKESKERAKEEFDEEVAVYQRLGLTEAAAQHAARGRAA